MSGPERHWKVSDYVWVAFNHLLFTEDPASEIQGAAEAGVPWPEGAFTKYIRADLHETVVKQLEVAQRERDEARAEIERNFEINDALQTELNALRALLDEARRNSERYLFLRDGWWLCDEYADTPDPMVHATTAEEFDTAIDDARIPRAEPSPQARKILNDPDDEPTAGDGT